MFFCFLQLKIEYPAKPVSVVASLFFLKILSLRDDFLLRNGLPAVVRCTFSKIVSDAHLWPLQIVAVVAMARAIFHVPKTALQKCARCSRKTYTL